MPTFDTPVPVTVDLDLPVGDIRIIAGDRTDTSVDVRPTDPAKKGDVTAAEQTRVEFTDGRLLIKAPKGWRQLRGGGDSIDVEIGLPSGSHIRGQAGVAALHSRGRLGECRYRNGMGEIQLDEAGSVQLKSGAGDITVERVNGHAEITTGTGTLRLGRIDGTAAVKNSNGDTSIRDVTGDVRVSAANGSIAIDQAHGTVAAKTAMGDIRVGEAVRGSVVAESGYGKVEVGVREGVAAWLDLNTRFGNLDNDLADGRRPEPGEDAVEVRARTGFGDITIRRSYAGQTGKGAT